MMHLSLEHVLNSSLLGLDELMPEGRKLPYKFLPRRGVALSVTFGQPVPNEDVKAALKSRTPLTEYEDVLPLPDKRIDDEQESGTRTATGWLDPKSTGLVEHADDLEHQARETARIRSAVTAVLHREVAELGRRIQV